MCFFSTFRKVGESHQVPPVVGESKPPGHDRRPRSRVAVPRPTSHHIAAKQRNGTVDAGLMAQAGRVETLCKVQWGRLSGIQRNQKPARPKPIFYRFLSLFGSGCREPNQVCMSGQYLAKSDKSRSRSPPLFLTLPELKECSMLSPRRNTSRLHNFCVKKLNHIEASCIIAINRPITLARKGDVQYWKPDPWLAQSSNSRSTSRSPC